MKKVIIATFITLTISAAYSQEKINLPSADSIQAMLIKMNVPGVSIATIENGVINKVMSVGQIMNKKPTPIDAIFNTASLAKAITAYLTVSLVEEGKLAMDEKLYKYWIDPDLKGDKRVKKLTPDIILSHRTGFDNWRTMNDEQKLRFNSDPGTAFSYSGEGYEYLRKSLEIKFDKTFSELVEAHILGPLNMQNTYLSWSDEVDEKTYAGEFKSLNEPYEITKSAPSAADDLLTTALDLGKFCEKLLERISTGAYHQYIEAKTEAMPGIKFSYGWIRFDELPNGGYALFNAGGDTGVSAMMCLLPETKEGIVILSNGENRGMVINLMKMALGANGAEMVSRFPQG